MSNEKLTGDFGYPKRLVEKEQIIGIYDLVGFTQIDSNKGLVTAVRAMQTAMELVLKDIFFYGELRIKKEESPRNNLWLSSTGDGYIVAFSQGKDDLKALEFLTEIHSDIRKQYPIRLGINKGKNFIVGDLNERVNLIGWGINYAARAVGFAEENQIICTGNFADPLIKDKGEIAKNLNRMGKVQVKKTKLDVYNYYKKGEFGAPILKEQRDAIIT